MDSHSGSFVSSYQLTVAGLASTDVAPAVSGRVFCHRVSQKKEKDKMYWRNDLQKGNSTDIWSFSR